MNCVRDNIIRDDVTAHSTTITRKLLSLDAMDVDTFCVYVSKGNEVDTHDLIRHLIAIGKRVTVPKIISDGVMQPYRLDHWDELEEGALGLLEPKTRLYLSRIDTCIVPGLAFTEQGARIGYGKGFYDRFFPKFHEATAIGLAYELQMLPELPQYEYDKRLDIIVTEERIIRCKQL